MAYITFQPKDFFNNEMYTGTGSSNAITGIGFQPDFTWIKNKDEGDFHVLTNSATGATKYMKADTDGALVTDTESLKSFDSDGFTVGTTAEVNTNTESFVSLNWRGGTTSGIATDGSTTITPSAYSFSQTAGISILQYTGNGTSGAGLAHGLGATPTFMVVKKQTVEAWMVNNVSMGPGEYITWNSSGAKITGNTDRWNNTDPDAVNIILGNGGSVNGSGDIYTCYCFTDIQGFSVSGSYEGNGNVDGPFIYTGFRPAMVLTKRTDSIEDWTVCGKAQAPSNVTAGFFMIDNADIPGQTGNPSDILSNGWKVRTTSTYSNASGGTYIYLAFAEFPIVSSNNVPTVAR